MNDDAQNLRYLTIGHYICAAIAAVFAGGLHDTGLDAAYGQGNVPATGGSWRSTGERSGTWRMARRNLR
jgi:hypothetical protein